jgi:hypothetical protein
MQVTSKILGLRLSFKWQPFLNDNVVKLVRQWANSYSKWKTLLYFAKYYVTTLNRQRYLFRIGISMF